MPNINQVAVMTNLYHKPQKKTEQLSLREHQQKSFVMSPRGIDKRFSSHLVDFGYFTFR